MKILTIHNLYKIRGGEDEVVESEQNLLSHRGHDVQGLRFYNEGISKAGLRLGLQTIWSQDSYRTALKAIDEHLPDIISVHNILPLASPSVYHAAAKRGIPVVQTLHNYRLLCPAATLFREGRLCGDCMHKSVKWPAVRHSCYRDSRVATAAVVAMTAAHKALRTWDECVTLFVALTEFSRRKHLEGGLPGEKVVVKPNFVPTDLGCGTGQGGFLLYVGRLSPEKGILDLLSAWKRTNTPGELVIVGDGPLAQAVYEAAGTSPGITYLGRVPLRRVYELMGQAAALAFPSRWFEGMPRVLIESLCRGTPVIASRLGSMEEMISDGNTGWLVDPDRPEEMIAAIERVLRGDCNLHKVRRAARLEFEQKYTSELNAQLLEDLYRHAIALNQRRQVRPASTVGECIPAAKTD